MQLSGSRIQCFLGAPASRRQRPKVAPKAGRTLATPGAGTAKQFQDKVSGLGAPRQDLQIRDAR